jgi:hypothetical protein
MKICQSGLNNLSRILVISTQNVIGANWLFLKYSFYFEKGKN